MEHIASTGQGPLFAENSSSRRTFTSSRDLGVYIDLYSLSPIDNAVQGLSGYFNLTFNPTVLIPTNAISFLGLVERGLTVNVFFQNRKTFCSLLSTITGSRKSGWTGIGLTIWTWVWCRFLVYLAKGDTYYISRYRFSALSNVQVKQ